MFKIFWSYRKSPNLIHSMTIEAWDEAQLFFEGFSNDPAIGTVQWFTGDGTKLGQYTGSKGP